MFTGIVTAVGRIEAVEAGPVHRFWVSSPIRRKAFEIGCSVAHAGACLTVVEVDPTVAGRPSPGGAVSGNARAHLVGRLGGGVPVNLERSLKVGDELGGHIVQGHVDGVGEVVDRIDADGWITFRVKAPEGRVALCRGKGSIAVDGVSLTVNKVDGDVFDLMIIPHTAEVTTLGGLQPGARVNLEVDVMARYAARLMAAPRRQATRMTGLSDYSGDSPLSPIEDIIEDARNGRMFILVDAEDRENEGDLIVPAQFATPDAVNFMAKHGRGLICLSMTRERAETLKLPLMAQIIARATRPISPCRLRPKKASPPAFRPMTAR
jgi:riboflavin synthase